MEHRSLSWIVKKLIDITKYRKNKDWDLLKDWSGENNLNSLGFYTNLTARRVQPKNIKERGRDMIKNGKL